MKRGKPYGEQGQIGSGFRVIRLNLWISYSVQSAGMGRLLRGMILQGRETHDRTRLTDLPPIIFLHELRTVAIL